MTISTALAATAAIAVGTLGAVTAYQVVAPPDAGSGAAEESAPRSRDARQRFAPCEQPARLEAGRCVTEKTRTIQVPGGTGPAQAPPPVPPSDLVDDHGGDGDHHGDDDGDDHGGDRDDVADELEDRREDREDALEDLRDAREDAAEDRAEEREDALEDARDDD